MLVTRCFLICRYDALLQSPEDCDHMHYLFEFIPKALATHSTSNTVTDFSDQPDDVIFVIHLFGLISSVCHHFQKVICNRRRAPQVHVCSA